MIDQTTFQWLVGILTLVILAGVFVILLEAMRMRWRQIGKAKLLIHIRTPIRTVEHHLVSRDENVLTAKMTNGKPFDYTISEEDTYTDDYPSGMPSIMQTTIGTATYDEGIATPLRRGVYTKEDAIRDSRVLAMAREKAQMDADAREMNRATGGGGNTPLITLILLIVITVVGCANAYLGYVAMTSNEASQTAITQLRDAILGKAK